MNKLTIIKQGESLPFLFDRGDNGIDGWTCTIYVKEKPSDADEGIFTARVVTPEGESWPGYLTTAETSVLTVLPKGAAYYLIGKLQNTTTLEEEIVTQRFRVTTAWV